MRNRTLNSTRAAGGAAAALGIIVCLTAHPAAQGLGDVAKQETERRQHVTAGKRYTNNDLPADAGRAPVLSRSSAPAIEAPTSKPERSAEGAVSPSSDPSHSEKHPADSAPPAKQPRDETYWRARATQLRSRLQQVQDQVRALEGRIDDLGTQLDRGADGSTLSEQNVAARGLATAQKEARFVQDEWDRFQARARALDISPDWIR